MITRRQAILEALVARVQAIAVSHGFNTDAGLTVFLGDAPQLGSDDPPVAIAVVPRETRIQSERMEILPVEIQALAKADIDQPYVAAEAMLSDIVTAVELEDRTLGGLVKFMELGSTRLLPREPGSTTVGTAILYELIYVRVFGIP